MKTVTEAAAATKSWCHLCLLLARVGMALRGKGTPSAESPLCLCSACGGFLKELVTSIQCNLSPDQFTDMVNRLNKFFFLTGSSMLSRENFATSSTRRGNNGPSNLLEESARWNILPFLHGDTSCCITQVGAYGDTGNLSPSLAEMAWRPHIGIGTRVLSDVSSSSESAVCSVGGLLLMQFVLGKDFATRHSELRHAMVGSYSQGLEFDGFFSGVRRVDPAVSASASGEGHNAQAAQSTPPARMPPSGPSSPGRKTPILNQSVVPPRSVSHHPSRVDSCSLAPPTAPTDSSGLDDSPHTTAIFEVTVDPNFATLVYKFVQLEMRSTAYVAYRALKAVPGASAVKAGNDLTCRPLQLVALVVPSRDVLTDFLCLDGAFPSIHTQTVIAPRGVALRGKHLRHIPSKWKEHFESLRMLRSGCFKFQLLVHRDISWDVLERHTDTQICTLSRKLGALDRKLAAFKASSAAEIASLRAETVSSDAKIASLSEQLAEVQRVLATIMPTSIAHQPASRNLNHRRGGARTRGGGDVSH